MGTSIKINLRPISEIKSDLGIENYGPVHAYFTELCEKEMDPFVPMGDTEFLASTVWHTVDEIHYDMPYAHYMYEGRVMGPNIPVFDDEGNIVKWWSKAPKYYTGEDIVYNKDKHPLATSHWDQVMWTAKKDEIEKKVAEYVMRGGKE